MTHFQSITKISAIFITLSLILILQGYQCEAKRFMDLYTTLFAYTLPKNNNTFTFINGSLTTPVGIFNTRSKNSAVKSHPGITVHVIVPQDVKDLKINFNISIERNGHYDTYLSVPIDACKGLEAKVDVPFLRFFRNEIIQVLKPPHRCPFKRNVRYEINNFIARNEFLPAYIPALNWKADLGWYFNGEHLVTLLIMGRIEWINI